MESKLIGGCAGTQFGCCSDGTTSKADQQGSNCPSVPVPKREYDQIVNGDVSIKKKGDHQYKIVFDKIGDFLLYQVWSDQTHNFNNDRNVFTVEAVDWVKEAFPNTPSNPPYQPTCIMELDFFNRYIFVIKKAKMQKGKVVFTVSTKEINLINLTPTDNLNLLTVIPQGTFLDMRFDINGGENFVFSPNPQEKDIVDILIGSTGYSTLVAAVVAADLVGTLKSAGPFTVFAPTNTAFAKLPSGTLTNLLKPENKAQLANILKYHVLAENLDAAAVVAAITKGNGSVTLTTVSGGKLIASMENGKVKLTDEAGNAAYVVDADLKATNGVIHGIDRVLFPVLDLFHC